jgi:hypothetical protein
MSPYTFFAATLRFVARQPTGGDAQTAAMMALLEKAATALEAGGAFTIAAADLALAGRAFAATAALLQKQILPEAVAHGHTAAETQIRWSVDAAMAAVTLLLSEAAAGAARSVMVTLPPPPV